MWGAVTAERKDVAMALKKLRMTIELEYDADLMHGGDSDEEGKLWFYGDILNNPDPTSLTLHDNGDLGDDIGTVKVLWIDPL